MTRILMASIVVVLGLSSVVAAADSPAPAAADPGVADDWRARLGIGQETRRTLARSADGRRELVLVSRRELSCGIMDVHEVRLVRPGLDRVGTVVRLTTAEQDLVTRGDGTELARAVLRRLRRTFPRRVRTGVA